MSKSPPSSPPTVRKEFTVHLLSDTGKSKAGCIAETMTRYLNDLESVCGATGREMAIMAEQPENQQPSED